jgi:transcription antitermination protein NusB
MSDESTNPPQAPATPKPRKAADKSARTRAREFALQALYQYLVGRNDVGDIDAFTRDLNGFHKADSVHYDALLHGSVAQASTLDTLISPLLDRPMVELSPIEHGVLWIGVYEFQHCPDVPWRVVLNECIELAKSFGGTDGHKYVNGVLHQLAAQLRPVEVAAGGSGGPRKAPRSPAAPKPAAPKPADAA